MNRTRLVILGALVAAVGIVIVVLSLLGDSRGGTLAVRARLTGGQGISQLHYRVSGDTLDRAGVVSAGADLSLSALPAGRYRLELTAASSDEKIKCARQDAFAITAGRTSRLEVAVLCRDLGNVVRFVMSRRAAAPGATPEAPPAVDVPPECTACEKTHIASGECEADSGCDRLTGDDKRLCQNLVNCMRATNCWVKDPLDCLCGSVDYVECTTHADGACLAEMQAATRTTDPIKNGTLFYDPTVPAGLANRLISCDKEMCRDHCAMP
jgi:hypothetical protein